MNFVLLFLSIVLFFVSGKRRELHQALVKMTEGEKDLKDFEELGEYMEHKFGDKDLSNIELGAKRDLRNESDLHQWSGEKKRYNPDSNKDYDHNIHAQIEPIPNIKVF